MVLDKSSYKTEETSITYGQKTFNDLPSSIKEKTLEESIYSSKDEIEISQQEAKKIDSVLSVSSLYSNVVQFNFIKVPQLTSKFYYNFYVKEEDDISSNEDQSKDPLIKNTIDKVPRYVHLIWDSTFTTNELQSESELKQEQKNNKDFYFKKPKGNISSNFTNNKGSYFDFKKNISNMKTEDGTIKLVDSDDQEKGFMSISNKYTYKNNIISIVKKGVSQTQKSKILELLRKKSIQMNKKKSEEQ